MYKKIIFYVSAAGFIVATSCGNKQAGMGQQGGPVPVTLEPVKYTDAVYYDEYPAIVVPLNEVELRAQVNGYITEIAFQEGEKVRKGQKLYVIDQQQYAANYEQALANLEVQKANLVKAQKDADRYHQLDKNDAIAKQQVDNADAILAATRKQVDAAKAMVSAAQTNVRYTTITAPFDGTIGISQVKVGAAVSAGQTLLNTVSTDNPIAADFTIDQSEIFRYSEFLAQKGKVKNDSTFRLAFSGQEYALPGEITLIDRAVDKQTGSMKVRVTFPNPDNVLRAGMSGTIRVRNDASVKSILIPYKAVTEMLGEYFVYVAGDSSKVFQQRVHLGKQVGQNVIIKEGLKPDQKIVTQGVQKLRDGAVITTEQAAAPGGPAKK